VPLAFHSGREADHSPPSSAEVKQWVELCLHSPNTLSWRGAQLGGSTGTTLPLPFTVCIAASLMSDVDVLVLLYIHRSVACRYNVR
jgi:hypothetical protein